MDCFFVFGVYFIFEKDGGPLDEKSVYLYSRHRLDGPAVSHVSAPFRRFAMEIGGFQVQPTLRPEDVVVAGIEPGWLVHAGGWRIKW